MSLALYRKYRPATFAELKGQEHVAEPLQQALRNGRIHHAYLFSGPRGCGKTSSARILARSLNCEKGPTPEPCGECESCVALGPSGVGHIDVIEIDAASHGGVDDARDLRERAFFAPVAARYKIYIIDEAHMVTREGFNALLKLVEEPPPHLKFIFATTEPEKVIGTIRSRTHHYPFRLIPPGTLRELLEDILQKEGVPYEPAAIPLVVRAGAGSARDSESILDQLLAGSGEEGITYARAVSLLGYTDSSLLDEVVDAVASRDGAAVFAAIDRVMEGGQDPRRFAADLLERFRDLVILSNVPDSGATGLLNVPPDELERMQAQAARLGPAELTRAADLLHTGLTEMRGATSPRLLLELIGARILLPGAYDDEASLLTRLERLERRVAIGGQAAAAAPVPTESPSQPSAAPSRPQPAAAQGLPPAPPEAARPQPPAPVPQEHESPLSRQTRPSQPPAVERRQSPPAQRNSEDGSPGGARSGSAGWPVTARPSEAGQSAGGGSTPASGQSSAAGRPTSTPSPSSPAPEAPTGAAAPARGVDVAAIRGMWVDILEAVKQRSKVAWIVLMEGVEIASLQGEVLTLAFANEGKRRGFTTGGKDAVLRDTLKEILGVDWRIDAVLAGGSGQGSRPVPPPPDPGGWGASAAPSRETRTTPPPESVPVPSPSPVPPPPEPVDEEDEVDRDGDADAGSESVLTGMALIEQVLGGKVIQEFDNT
ncbi:DNA polymerase III subunit gamma and tau [Actinoallomurus purpureus]|uniref:DNA polymerase III subunit gamma and tau n=1 Tax=Actinoallomurus purpureus TaxID=478114 RepID=UPI002093E244|nr:DNA polymerase III subunit gamma and tau [Actinoallomurus purpureus]MCO6007185.1 DNA polymerase III subunit gamma and tau [Actinoallomurus purpureus]